MECVRCHGLMVVDRFVDLEASSDAAFTGWRCVVCGHISDPVIIANRHPPGRFAVGGAPGVRSRPSGGSSAD